MPSTFTDSLRLEEQGVGENSNTWGDKLNSTIDLIDKSIAGHVGVATTGGTTQLTTVNNGEDQARYKIIEITGTLGSNVIIEVPAVSKEYIVWDSTTRGGFTINFRIGGAGATVAIPASTVRAFGVSTDGSAWRPLSAELASETAPGIVEVASTAEAQGGSSNSVVLTPVRLQDVTATTGRRGVVELATNAEATTGTDTNRAVTPSGTKAVMDAHLAAGDPHSQYTTTAEASAAAPVQSVNGETGTVVLDAADVGATPSSHVGTGGAQHASATTTTSGFVELATQTEVNAETDTTRAVVPSTLKGYVDIRVVAATTTAQGIIEIATQAEVNAGSDTTRAVVPSTLKSYVDGRLNTTADLGTAAQENVGTALVNIPDTGILNTRLGTTGNLGTMATETATDYLERAEFDPESPTSVWTGSTAGGVPWSALDASAQSPGIFCVRDSSGRIYTITIVDATLYTLGSGSFFVSTPPVFRGVILNGPATQEFRVNEYNAETGAFLQSATIVEIYKL